MKYRIQIAKFIIGIFIPIWVTLLVGTSLDASLSLFSETKQVENSNKLQFKKILDDRIDLFSELEEIEEEQEDDIEEKHAPQKSSIVSNNFLASHRFVSNKEISLIDDTSGHSKRSKAPLYIWFQSLKLDS